MSCKRYLRLRRLLKRRRLITCLREANRNFAQAQAGMEAVKTYQPICMGGVEDKMAAEDQAYGRLRYWGAERYELARRLRLNSIQASLYK